MRVGTVVTFYSYKGGVGRTFALANVAAALAHWGHRVLCIDWDLDAPGLPFYFRLEKPTRGILELVFSIKDGSNPRWQEFVTSVDLPETSDRLDLITAGLGDETYVDRAQRIDWANMYEQHGLDEWLECWRSQWKKDYDFVLVDSRTGVTDIGAICTVQLPDILVFLFTANKQSLEGAVEIVNRVKSARNKLQSDRSGILMVPVISRFDSTKEYKLAESWREIIEQKIAQFYEPWIAKGVKASDIVGRTIIPYVPYWSFGERLPVIEEKLRGTDSIRFYLETLAALIGHRLDETRLLADSPEQYIAHAARTGRLRGGFAHDVFVTSTPDLVDQAQKLQFNLQQGGLDVIYTSLETTLETEADWPESLEQSQHAVFLIGKEQTSWMIATLRRFAKQALDEEHQRMVIPVVTKAEMASALPAILRQSQISIDETTSSEELATSIIRMLQLSLGEQLPVSEATGELSWALTNLRSGDPFLREGAVRALARLKSQRAYDALRSCIGDPNPVIHHLALDSLEKTDDPYVKEYLINLLQSDDPKARREAALMLGHKREKRAFLDLVQLLGSSDTNDRLAAATALGQLGDPAASDWLLPRLADPVQSVRYQVAEALVRIGEAGDRNTLHSLLQYHTKSINWEKRGMIQNAFKAVGRSQAAAFLLDQLHDELSGYALDLLGNMRSSEVVEEMIARLKGSKPEVRVKLIPIIARIAGEKSLGALFGCVEDENPKVRTAAIQSLGERGDGRAFDPVKAHLEDPEPGVRIAAIAALGSLKDTRGVKALAAHLDDTDPEVRQAAAIALGEIGDRNAVKPLLEHLDDQDTNVRKAVAASLGQLGGKQALDALVHRLSDADPQTRQAAAIALGEIGDRNAVEPLLQHLDDPDTNVRVAAIRNVARLGGNKVLGALVEQLNTEGTDTRLTVIEAIGNLGDKRAVMHLVPLFDGGDTNIRVTALRSAAKLAGSSSALQLVSRDADGRDPWLDPSVPIDEDRVTFAATRLGHSPEEIKRLYEVLSKDLQFKLNLSWVSADAKK